jgi:hypothetical protein
VRRSFQPDSDLTANLSEAELSLFDTLDPDDPRELGRVELAPNYTHVYVIGDHRVRVKNGRDFYGGWWGDRAELPAATVEIVPAHLDPDGGEPVARFEVPADAKVYQTGDLLVAHTQMVVDGSKWPYTYQSELAVYDLSDPTNPRPAGRLKTDRLRPSYGYSYFGPVLLDCLDCGRLSIWPGGDAAEDVRAVPGGLVFLQRQQESTASRYWQSFALEVLELTDPDAPRLADTVELGREKEGVGMLTHG